MKKHAVRLTAFEDLCLTLVVLVTVLSVVKAVAVPLNDSALYEWYGFNLLHGQHLYTDLPEVKLPSLYYTNSLLVLLFGNNYFLHTCAEAALNLGTVALFAGLLRRLEVAAWAPGTLLFSIFYMLPIAQFNYPEYYAIPLMLVCFHLALRGRNVLAGCVMALATTFWIPSPIMFVPLLMRKVSWSERRSLIGGFVGIFVAFTLAFIPFLGVRWILQPLSLWPSFLRPLSAGFTLETMRVQLSATAFHAGLLALVILLLVVVRRPQTEAQRFGLWWTLVAAIAAVIPPRFFVWYFLPLVTALSMTIAAYGFEPALLRNRPLAVLRSIAALTFAGLFVNGILLASTDAKFVRGYADNVATVGSLIRNTVGTGWVIWTPQYVPEVYLVTEGTEPDVGASNTGHYLMVALKVGGGVTIAPDKWERVPQIVVDGGPFRPAVHQPFVQVADPGNNIARRYVAICSNKTGALALYALAELCPVLTSQNPECTCPGHTVTGGVGS